MENNLELYNKNKILVFSSHKKWIYPIFDLDVFLKNIHFSTKELLLKDKVIGKAAAVLMIKMHIRNVYTLCITRDAFELFKFYGVECDYEEIVDVISCKLEESLKDKNDIEEMYEIILERTGHNEYSIA